MYSENFQKSLELVEKSREANIALEPERMTAKQKEDLLAAFHPDYRQDQFDVLKIGPNKGDKVPFELAEILQAHSRITADSVDFCGMPWIPASPWILSVEMWLRRCRSLKTEISLVRSRPS